MNDMDFFSWASVEVVGKDIVLEYSSDISDESIRDVIGKVTADFGDHKVIITNLKSPRQARKLQSNIVKKIENNIFI